MHFLVVVYGEFYVDTLYGCTPNPPLLTWKKTLEKQICADMETNIKQIPNKMKKRKRFSQNHFLSSEHDLSLSLS